MSEIVQPRRFCGVLCISRSTCTYTYTATAEKQRVSCATAVAELLVENEHHMLDKAGIKPDTLIIIHVRLPNNNARNYTVLKCTHVDVYKRKPAQSINIHTNSPQKSCANFGLIAVMLTRPEHSRPRPRPTDQGQGQGQGQRLSRPRPRPRSKSQGQGQGHPNTKAI